MNSSLWKLGAVLGLLSSVGPFAIDMYLPALPTIAMDLGTSVSASQASIMVFLIALGLGQLVFGPLSDQYGRKAPLFAGLIIFLAGSLGCLFAPTVEWLIGARFVQGMGAAAMGVIPRAIVRDRHTGHTATRLMSTIMIVVSVSPLFAPLIGSGLLQLGSWRVVFGLLCLLGIIGVFLTTSVLSETLPLENRRPVNVGTMTAGMAMLLSHRQFLCMSLVNSCGLASFFVFIASAPFIYTEVFGLTPTQFSLAFAINAMGFFGASQFAAPLSKRFGSQRLVFGAILGFASLTALLMFLSILGQTGLVTISTVLVVANACLGLVIPTASVLAIHDHPEIAGLASSVGGAMQWMSGAAVVLLVGPFFDETIITMTVAIAACGAAALICAVLATPRNVPESQRRET
ncbi:multidrug effflux MFS transporter [Roseibium porphyridii]|uniref:Bcr/CflA family efflux transporter n=1 Tax=Roseibium porphyridii TaxID=2866279 RepID=A0ABY8FB13_9HYPH|nr:multidrug effflux MFS transporter [Roseibium sp. KMA01]WFE89808.1 multidrug effflux MFS transporter [Roseibium sp. KMA01]